MRYIDQIEKLIKEIKRECDPAGQRTAADIVRECEEEDLYSRSEAVDRLKDIKRALKN